MTGPGNVGMGPGPLAADPAAISFKTAEDVLLLAAGRPDMIACLEAVAALGLPDCWIGAGFVRAPVWDALHGYSEPTPLDDIDVVYFDPDSGDTREKPAETALAKALPLPWSVINQARMHLYNEDPPYRDTGDALANWLETATAVALRLNPSGRLELLAPHGLEDLFALRVRPTPRAREARMEAYRARLERKKWQEKWPRLIVDWD